MSASNEFVIVNPAIQVDQPRYEPRDIESLGRRLAAETVSNPVAGDVFELNVVAVFNGSEWLIKKG